MRSAPIPKQSKIERADALWSEIDILKKYFESLKFRDTIIGRFALVSSVAWIFVDLPESLYWLEILPAFLFVMLIYWVAQNGYFATIAALFSMVLENNFNPWLKNTDELDKENIKLIEEKRVLLTNYAAAAPNLRLLYFIHRNRIKKSMSLSYRFYAEHPRFKKELKIGFCRYLIAHFLPCERYTDKKIRAMTSINDIIRKIKHKED